MRRVALIAAAVFGVLAAGLLLWQFRTIVFLIAGALVLAATLYPIGETVVRWNLPRWAAVMANLLVTVVGLLLFLGISGYVLADNLPRALVDFQTGYAEVRGSLLEGSSWQQTVGRQLPEAEGFEDLLARLQTSAVAAGDEQATDGAIDQPLGAATDPNSPAPSATSAAGSAQTDATGQAGAAGNGADDAPATNTAANAAEGATAEDAATESAQRATGLLRVIVGTTSSVAGWLTQFIVLIFVALYWTTERDTVERLWMSLVPAANRQRLRTTWRRVEEDLGRSVRSQLLQALFALVLLWLGFWAMGMTYPLLAAWIGALLWLIPLVGWLMALPVIALLGLLEGALMGAGASAYALLVFAMLGFLIRPRLDVPSRTGSVTGLIVALILFSSLGLLGLLVATPLAVALHTLVGQATAPRLTQSEVQAVTGQTAAAQVSTAQAVATQAAVVQAAAVLSGAAPTEAAAATATTPAVPLAPVAPASPASTPGTAAPAAAALLAAGQAASAAQVAAPVAAAGLQALRDRLSKNSNPLEAEEGEIPERTLNLYRRLLHLLDEAEEALPAPTAGGGPA